MAKRIILTAALFVAATIMASAQPPAQQPERPQAGRGQMERRMNMRHPMLEQLNLTDQQKGEMQKLRVEMEKQSVQTGAKIHLARIEMRELFTADKPDRGAIEKRMKEVSDLEFQMKLDRLNHMFAVNALLTPEQQKIWKQHMGSLGSMGPMIRREIRKRIGPGFGEMQPMEEEETEGVEED